MADGKRSFAGRLYVLLLGAAVAALAWAWRFETVPPDMMDDLAAAAGLRPPTGPVSLLWQFVAIPLCRNFGLQTAGTVLRNAGHVSLGILAVMVTALFSLALPASFGRGEHVAAWWRAVVRFVLFQGSALFCLSDPVWSAFRWFSPVALQNILAVMAATCYMTYLRTGRRSPLFASFALAGLLFADTPVGALLIALAVVGLCLRNRLRMAGLVAEAPENPLAEARMPLRLTLLFVVCASIGVALEAKAFDLLGGLAAFGWTWGDYACNLPLYYVKALLGALTPVGAILFVAVAVVPVFVEFRLLKRATDEERRLSYMHGLMFLVCGLVAFSQFSGAKSLWFWTWAGGCVRDGFLKCAAMCLSARATVWTLAVFTFDLYLRNFRRVEALRQPDAVEATGADEAFATLKRLRSVVRVCLLAEPVVAFLCVVPFRSHSLEREMLGVVADAARETAEECAGADYVFTDGGLDAAVELAAAESGRSLRALSLMGSAADARDIYMRTRGAENAEDRALLESGAPDALRTWVRTRPDKAATYAVQIGFEVWRRDGRTMPECGGLVARPPAAGAVGTSCGTASGLWRCPLLLPPFATGLWKKGDGRPGSFLGGVMPKCKKLEEKSRNFSYF